MSDHNAQARNPPQQQQYSLHRSRKPKQSCVTDLPLLALITSHWRIHGIMNDSLMQDKVRLIPERFSSATEYLDSFKWPFLEEVRASLKSSMEESLQAPVHYSQILKTNVKRISHGTFNVCSIKLKHAVPGTIYKSMDLVLLTTGPPTSIQKLLRSSTECDGATMSVMLAFCEHSDTSSSSLSSWTATLRLLMNSSDARAAWCCADRPDKKWYAVSVGSLATSLRVWNALHTSNFSNLVKSMLNCYRTEQNKDGVSDPCLHSTLTGKAMHSYCTSAGSSLNKSQTNAVTTVLHEVLKGDSKSAGVYLIQGPPGTGKTSTIIRMLSIASCLGTKCLVTAPTNIAVTTIATRFLRLLDKSSGTPQFAEFVATGFLGSQCNLGIMGKLKKCKVLRKADMVIVGNEENLKLRELGSADLQDLYLPNRVKKVSAASQGWKRSASMLFKLLGQSSSAKPSNPAPHQKLKGKTKKKSRLSFVAEMKMKLEGIVAELVTHEAALLAELPNHRSETLSETIQLASLLLDSLSERLACRATAGNEGADRRWFLQSEHRLGLVQELKGIKNRSYWTEEAIEKLCLKSACLFFCTVSTAGGPALRHALPLDCVIIDEAAQLVEAHTTILTCKLGIQKAVLVGDPQQLPATVISRLSEKCGYGRSLFERLVSNGFPPHLLNTQYRMNPSISLFPNTNFYGSKLRNGGNVRNFPYNAYDQLLYGPYAFIDVHKGVEKTDGKSNTNHKEANVMLAILQRLRKAVLKKGISSLSVGIITLYSGQRNLLKNSVARELKLDPLSVDINSVDGFQGQERDIILLSTVRSNAGGHIGFLKDPRRLNVAITRAKYCLWIFGNKRTLSMQPAASIWSRLLQDAVSRGVCMNVGDEPVATSHIVNELEDHEEAEETSASDGSMRSDCENEPGDMDLSKLQLEDH